MLLRRRLASSCLARTVHARTRRHITTQPATFANIKYELQSRPPRIYHDYLVPTNSHLLSLSVADERASSPPSPSSSSTADIDHHNALPSITSKSPLPQGHHLVYFPPTHPTASLLPDGTDTDQFPGAPFVRRLWASGSLTFHNNDASEQTRLLLDGRRAVCVEKIDDVRITGVPPGEEARTGNAPGHGEKIFVDVVRRYAAIPDDGTTNVDIESIEADPAVEERRTLVFLTAKTAEEAKQDITRSERKEIRAMALTPTHTLTIRPTPALLFRFSALSFNAHLIHLDREHCRKVEGYRETLVHGPLLLTLLCTALREALVKTIFSGKPPPAIKTIDYRNLAPVHVDESFRVCVRQGGRGEDGTGKWHVWVEGPDGGLRVKGSATVG